MLPKQVPTLAELEDLMIKAKKFWKDAPRYWENFLLTIQGKPKPNPNAFIEAQALLRKQHELPNLLAEIQSAKISIQSTESMLVPMRKNPAKKDTNDLINMEVSFAAQKERLNGLNIKLFRLQHPKGVPALNNIKPFARKA
jgi:hypothetical protein